MKTVEIYTDGEDGFAASMIKKPSGSPLVRQPPDMERKRRRYARLNSMKQRDKQ